LSRFVRLAATPTPQDPHHFFISYFHEVQEPLPQHGFGDGSFFCPSQFG
jgi:hypothetical protein